MVEETARSAAPTRVGPLSAPHRSVPNFLAVMLASAVAWLVDDAFPPLMGVRFGAVLAVLAWMVVFYTTRNTLAHLRPES